MNRNVKRKQQKNSAFGSVITRPVDDRKFLGGFPREKRTLHLDGPVKFQKLNFTDIYRGTMQVHSVHQYGRFADSRRIELSYRMNMDCNPVHFCEYL